jgi:four helix bundle protein
MDGHKSLRVFQLSYKLAMEIFEISRSFPREERYALTDQIRRSSRSVAANIAEGYRKRQYSRAFVNKMSDADGEAAETQVWLDVAKDCRYIDDMTHERLISDYRQVGSMLGHMIQNPGKFKPRTPVLPTATANRQQKNG